jgi:hypothetical protein
VVTAGALTASALLLGACGVGNVVGPQHEDKITYSVTESVAALNVDSGSGDITVIESDRSGIAVTETRRWRGEEDGKPLSTHEVNGDRLTLTFDCPGLIGNCDVEYRVEVPRGLKVKADSGSGEIVLRGLSGEVEVYTGSGGIDGNGLTAKRLVGETGSGDIEVRFGSTPDDVNLETGSGDGVVWVPTGKYNVTAETGSGEERVEVNRDGGSPHKVVVRAGSGDVKVLPGAGA